MTETECQNICDMIAFDLDDLDAAMRFYRAALADDPTESGHAAHIRDTIRDNFADATI